MSLAVWSEVAVAQCQPVHGSLWDFVAASSRSSLPVDQPLDCCEAPADGVDTELTRRDRNGGGVGVRQDAGDVHVLAEQPVWEGVGLAAGDGRHLLARAGRRHGNLSEIPAQCRERPHLASVVSSPRVEESAGTPPLYRASVQVEESIFGARWRRCTVPS